MTTVEDVRRLAWRFSRAYIDRAEMRELVIDAWRMAVSQPVARGFLGDS